MADDLLRHRLPAGHLPVRLVGMGVSGLDDTGQVQGMLFDGEDRQKQSRVDAVADEIKERFGRGPAEGEQPSGRKPQDAVASILAEQRKLAARQRPCQARQILFPYLADNLYCRHPPHTPSFCVIHTCRRPCHRS